MKKILMVLCLVVLFTGCEEMGTSRDIYSTVRLGSKLAENQPTPNDIDYSLERYNLIRRTYWVNGQREKAVNLPCPVVKPFGYIVLFTENGGIVGSFTVDGNVSSLTSFLTCKNNWIPDVDGSYGENDNMGIFFFTNDGKYIEWTGTYLYSDIPMKVENPIVKYEIGGNK